MNNLTSSILFLFFVSFLTAQINWTELPPTPGTSLALVSVLEDDRFIGVEPQSGILYLSDDKGTTWEEMYNGSLKMESKTKVKENINGEIFLIHNYTLYQYDFATQSLERFFAASDFFFLDSGELILFGSDSFTSRRGLFLFDQSLSELAYREISENTSYSLLKGYNDIHYLYITAGSRDIFSFSTDLSTFSPVSSVPPYRSYARLDIDEQGVLYGPNSYYIQGQGGWTEYPDDVSGYPIVTKDGRLHLINHFFKTYVSSDGGLSFDEHVVETEFELGSKFFLFEDMGILGTNSGCHPFVYSSDGITNWQEKTENTRVGLLQANYQVVFTDNIITTQNYDQVCPSFLKYDDVSGWQEYKSEVGSEDCYYYYPGLNSIPDGTLFSSTGCSSKDEGRTWSRSIAIRWYSDFRYNATALFYMFPDPTLPGNIHLYRSDDFGSTWQDFKMNLLSFPEDPQDIEVRTVGVSSEGNFYMAIRSKKGKIYKFGPDGDYIKEIILPVPDAYINQIEGDFQSSKIYIKANENLLILDEISESIEILDLPISFNHFQIDFNDNIYLYNESQVFYSQDFGNTWINISPTHPELISIEDLEVGFDGHLYLATVGTSILKSQDPLSLKRNKLQLAIYDDENGNCQREILEENLAGIFVTIDSTFLRPTLGNGTASFFLPDGNYRLGVDYRNDLYNGCSFSQDLSLQGGEVQTLEIGLQILEECADLNVTGTTPFLRRCFDNTYNIEITNEGNEVASNVNVEIKLDTFFEFEYCDFPFLSSQGNLLTFGIGDISPGESKRGKLVFNLSCFAPRGAAHYLEAALVYDNPCQLLLGESAAFECRENIGSYDPNDKQIYIDGVLNAEIIADSSTIEYLIRFQNTGTDTAFTVRVEDRLTEDFDLSALQPVAASHDYIWEINRSKLIVIFDDINLVDSTRNEPDSHGFIRFRAPLKEARPPAGSIIENTAAIYFDYNDPIITNTVETHYLCKESQTTIEDATCEGISYYWPLAEESYNMAGTYSAVVSSELGCDSTVVLELSVLDENHPDCQSDATEDILVSQISLFPNPAQRYLTIAHKDNIRLMSCAMYNLQGALVLEHSFESSPTLSVEELDEAIYLIDIRLRDGHHVRKRVVVIK